MTSEQKIRPVTNVRFETLRKLLDYTLEPEDFSHLDHIAVAYEAQSRHSFFEATHLVADGLAKLAARAGVPEKFHATITGSYMCLIAERMEQSPSTCFDEFIKNNQDLLSSSLVTAYFTKDQLASNTARCVMILPTP